MHLSRSRFAIRLTEACASDRSWPKADNRNRLAILSVKLLDPDTEFFRTNRYRLSSTLSALCDRKGSVMQSVFPDELTAAVMEDADSVRVTDGF